MGATMPNNYLKGHFIQKLLFWYTDSQTDRLLYSANNVVIDIKILKSRQHRKCSIVIIIITFIMPFIT